VGGDWGAIRTVRFVDGTVFLRDTREGRLSNCPLTLDHPVSFFILSCVAVVDLIGPLSDFNPLGFGKTPLRGFHFRPY